MTDSTCIMTVDDANDATHACALDAGHPGPVHTSSDGVSWGDPALPPPDES